MQKIRSGSGSQRRAGAEKVNWPAKVLSLGTNGVYLPNGGQRWCLRCERDCRQLSALTRTTTRRGCFAGITREFGRRRLTSTYFLVWQICLWRFASQAWIAILAGCPQPVALSLFISIRNDAEETLRRFGKDSGGTLQAVLLWSCAESVPS